MKGMATPSSILPGEFDRQKSLASYSPWGHKELYMTEQLTLVVSLALYCWVLISKLP